jgi:hypothetical protein
MALLMAWPGSLQGQSTHELEVEVRRLEREVGVALREED